MTPPLGAWGYTNPTRDAGLGVSLGGLGAGLITKQGLWFEGTFRLLRGLETVGSDATALAGYAVGREVAPGNWDFSIPLYGGYRFANRPGASPSDGYPLTEHVHFLVAGARAVWTRHYRTMALELSLGALAGLPISATPPASAYYSDPPTRSWVEGTALVGWVFDG
ncbi:MAG TPA: hypothetical protein VFQ61_38870 [Polyangiaceae bacterium]|nr:hypothetical protein [Polyangiaceae bacterium]